MPSVAILLAVYQGERFLEEQIESLANQTVKTVHIVASDDGSTDGSIKILEKAQQSWTKGDFHIIHGPQKGFAQNFRFLLNSKVDADYFAFSDQDDIWDHNKLEKALAWSAGQNPTKPQVHGNRTRIVDEAGNFIANSQLFLKPPSFKNAVMQNIAAGHTTVMNRAARDLMAATAKHIDPISHDHWIYLIVTGAGGIYHYSLNTCVSYRQHHTNVTGAYISWHGRLRRIKRVLRGEVRTQTTHIISALEGSRDFLTPSAKSVLESLRLIHRSNSIFSRLCALYKSGIYRQTWTGKISMYVICMFRLL